MIERLNKAILNSANNLPAALLLLLIVYVMAEAHNYAALREFSERAGVPTFLSYLTPIMMGLFILIVYWVLVAYKSQGHSTFGPWLAVIAFVVGSAILNIEHFGYAPNQISIALLSPALILFGGTLAKDIVSKQVQRISTIETLKKLKEDAQKLTHKLHNLKREVADLDAQKSSLQQEIEAQNRAKIAKFEALQQEIETLLVQKTEAQEAVACANDVPEKVRQAIQLDALLAAGLSQTEAANTVGVHRNTVQSRLQLVNGNCLGRVQA